MRIRSVRAAEGDRRRRLRPGLLHRPRIFLSRRGAPGAGRRGHRARPIQLGDTVEVRLVEAIPTAGALRFEMLSEGRYIGARPQGARPRSDNGRPAGLHGQGRRTSFERGRRSLDRIGQRRIRMMQDEDHDADRLPQRRRGRLTRSGLASRCSAAPSHKCPACGDGATVPALSQGRGQLPALRRGVASSPRRRRAALFHHRHRRPRRGRASCLLVEMAYRPPLWLHAALWLPLTVHACRLSFCRRSRARSSACNGRSACMASIPNADRGRHRELRRHRTTSRSSQRAVPGS